MIYFNPDPFNELLLARDATTDMSLVITAAIAFLNIVTTAVLTFVNYKNLKLKDEKNNKQKVFVKYYIPICYSLKRIVFLINRAKLQDKKFDIFELNYTEPIKTTRAELIEEYKSFLKEFSNLDCCLYDKEIDSEIGKVYDHINFISFSHEREIVFDMEGTRNKYPMPNFEEIVNLIEQKRNS